CGGETGTISLKLATAPGSDLLADVVTARLTLSIPRREVTATRDADGKFHLSIDVAADGPSSNVTFEGLDAGGALVAYGCSGPLPIAAIDADVAVYVGAPGTLAAAPVPLDRPRADAGTADFSFGVLIAGGLDPAGAASAAVDVYDVYSHSLQRGLDLPAARRAPTVAPGVTGYAYVFGGDDAAGAPTGTLWRFDTTVSPAGAYLMLADAPELARSGAAATAIRPEGFLVTGAPPQAPAVIDGLTSTVTALPATPAMVGTASSITTADGSSIAAVAGAGTGTSGLAIVTTAGVSDEQAPAGAARTGHGAAVGDGVVTLVGGAIGDTLATTGVRLELVHRLYSEREAGLATPRRDAAVAQVGGQILVAGGTDADGHVLADAEVLDAFTLDHVATIPLVAARTRATAHALSTGQILLVGGVDADGAPVGTMEIFTPDPAAFSGGAVACGLQ
ncbi:MAG TPA: hypothetical protein VHE35_19930, partial [Kofleriaceae bacterium]|nr:hypothetical protein [Kofleriaceae bacterium]